MPRNSQNRGGNRSGSKNNNPQGRNQYSNGLFDMARERPAAAAAVAAGAAAAGVFLWSKRDRISEQLSHISDQIGEWTESMTSERELEMAGGDTNVSGSSRRGATGDFTAMPTASTSRGTASASRTTGSKRRSATSGRVTGSGTMSGGSLDTGPSGRGRA